MDTEIDSSNRLYIWKLYLSPDGSEQVDLANVEFDLENQRVIKTDVDRTRNLILTADEKDAMERILTLFCKNENIWYKQGLNEVVAPFLLLNREGLEMEDVYRYFKGFVSNYLPTMFNDREFRSLQSQFAILKLLIKYFDPRLASFLISHKMNPELFATPWFLTLFSSKMNLDMVYRFWDNYMIENDNLFI